MRQDTIRAVVVALAAMFPAGGAFAGGAAVIENQSQGLMGSSPETTRITLEWRDAETVRLETQGESGYLLVREGKAYSVMEENGALQVIDLGAMMKMMSAGNEKKGDTFGSVDAAEPTGRSAQIAGIEGSFYNVTTTDGAGKTSVETWVLSDDPLATEMTEAFHRVAMAMVGTSDGDKHFARMKDALPDGLTGILKAGQRYRVISISWETAAPARFELPAPPMDMGAFVEN